MTEHADHEPEQEPGPLDLPTIRDRIHTDLSEVLRRSTVADVGGYQEAGTRAAAIRDYAAALETTERILRTTAAPAAGITADQLIAIAWHAHQDQGADTEQSDDLAARIRARLEAGR